MEVNFEILRKWICDIMSEANFEAGEFDVVDLCAYGSRTNGRAHEDSDLDILLEYKGSAREDTVFNVLHDTPIYLQGRDRENPINIKEHMDLDAVTLEEYLKSL